MAATVSGLNLRPDGQSEFRRHRLKKVGICLGIFLLALFVRTLHWQDNRPVFGAVFTGMASAHKENANTLLSGDLRSFLAGPAPPTDANILTYPPGYPIFIATIFKVLGGSDSAVRVAQIALDGGSAVLLFLLAANLFRTSIGIIAGLLAALSPQLSYYSTLLLPDSLATFPLVLGLYLLAQARRKPRMLSFVAVGFCIGVSCWLRSNALLLAPFIAGAVMLMFDRARRLRYALAVLVTTLVVISPITLRNYVVFHHFIPLSLGAGHMLSIGISDYDKQKRFGLPATDFEAIRMEREQSQIPEDAKYLYGGDGIARERMRTTRAMTVIRSHPIWFAGVVARRAGSMLRFERVHAVSRSPAPIHSLNVAPDAKPIWTYVPDQTAAASVAKGANGGRSEGGTTFQLAADFLSPPVPVESDTDYLLIFPIKVEHGSLVISITNAQRNVEYASSPIVHPPDPHLRGETRWQTVMIPFVSRNADEVSVGAVVKRGQSGAIAADMGPLSLYKLGPARLQWLFYPRTVIHAAQKIFLTAAIIPFALIGLAVIVRMRLYRELIVLLIMPVYYMTAQAVLHTEYRYVMAVQYPLFVFVGVAIYSIASGVRRILEERWPLVRGGSR